MNLSWQHTMLDGSDTNWSIPDGFKLDYWLVSVCVSLTLGSSCTILISLIINQTPSQQAIIKQTSQPVNQLPIHRQATECDDVRSNKRQSCFKNADLQSIKGHWVKRVICLFPFFFVGCKIVIIHIVSSFIQDNAKKMCGCYCNWLLHYSNRYPLLSTSKFVIWEDRPRRQFCNRAK